MTCGIYSIENKLNGKSYIGSSINIERRWEIHRWHLRKGHHHSQKLQRAWDKYGGEFLFLILEIVDDQRDLIERERHWVSHNNTVANGYNVCPVGANHLGVKRSDLTKSRISAALTGKKLSPEHCRILSISRLGKKTQPCSEEKKQKIAASLMGRKHTAERRAKISAAKLGKKRGAPSAETRAKMSISQKGKPRKPMTPEAKAHLSAWWANWRERRASL